MLVYYSNNIVRRQDDVKGMFDDYKNAAEFISKTKVLDPKIRRNNPHIIIGPNTVYWYYFLDKFLFHEKYNFHYAENDVAAGNYIRDIRTGTKNKSANPGANFWFLTNKKEDLLNAYDLANTIEGGRDIHMLYHGSDYRDTKIPASKIIFADPSR